MPRPCQHPDNNLQVESCHICKLFVTREDYRKLWGGGCDGQPPTLVPCQNCGGKTKIKASPAMATTTVLNLITGKKSLDSIAGKWHSWSSVIQAHRMLLAHAAISARDSKPPELNGQGIVMLAGGTCTTYGDPVSYFDCAYTAAWVLRRTGCDLPLQFWYLDGELTEEQRRLSANVGAELVDASAIGVQQQMRCPGGWQLKIYAILNCPWREVIYIDSDNIVAQNPANLLSDKMYQRHGCLFWGDNPEHWSGHISADAATRVGWAELNGTLDFETGQMVIDKRKCWQALQVVKHLADHADYWGGTNGGIKGIWYGDKTDFHVGFSLVGKSYHLFNQHDWCKSGFYRHCDSNADIVFQHAAHRKKEIAQGEPVEELVGNDDVYEAVRMKSVVPWMDGSVVEADKLINPEKHFAIGPSAIARTVWLDVVARNEYRLPDKFSPEDIVIDIGANVGAFSYAVLRRGAGKVIAVEPGREGSGELLRENLSGIGVYEWMDRAVWYANDILRLWDSDQYGSDHTCGRSVIREGKSFTQVFTITLDQLIEEVAGLARIRLIKLDCEGSEYPILYSCTLLSQVDQIVGEYHNDISETEAPKYWNGQDLAAFLREQGFIVDLVPHGESHGNFYAQRASK